MLKPIKHTAKKSVELTGILMCSTGAVVWFFAAYFIFCKVMYESVKFVQHVAK